VTLVDRSGPRKVNTFIFGTAQYQVIRAAVIAQQMNGGEHYVYRNGLLPANTDPANIEHLLSLGMIRKIEGAAS
jgi:hypothetical protein